MPAAPPKMIKYLKDEMAVVQPQPASTPTVPHYARSDIEITNAFQAAFPWRMNDHAYLYDLVHFDPANPDPAIPLNYGIPVGVRDALTHDVIIDESRESEVRAIVSRRAYNGGMTISGLDVAYISELCPSGSTQLRYTAATTTLEISIDGGATWGPINLDVSTLSEGDAGYVLAFPPTPTDFGRIVVVRNADPLPVADVVSSLAMDTTRWSIMFMSYEATGGVSSPSLKPFQMPADKWVYFYVPFLADLGTIPPMDRIMKMYDDIRFKDIVVPGYGGGGDALLANGDVPITIEDQATLPAVPTAPTRTKLWLNGILLRYNSDYTFVGADVTFIPGNLGYHVETTDWLYVEVF